MDSLNLKSDSGIIHEDVIHFEGKVNGKKAVIKIPIKGVVFV